MQLTGSKQIRSLLTWKELYLQGNFEPESNQRTSIIARIGVFTMPAWQDFIIVTDQGYHVFPILPFSHWEFYGEFPVLLQHCVLDVRAVQGRQVAF